jgi:uncharacterized cupredoxin-like copper-binding protein
MKRLVIAATFASLAIAGPAFSAGDLSRANVIDVVLEMGSNDDGMYFKPDHFEFETGQAYKLVMKNVDEIKHEVSLHEMGERIFTRKIEVSDAQGNFVSEIKGNIIEVEVGAGQTVDWFFVPVQTIENPVEITCEIPGHYESGMHATAVIK